MADEQGPGGGEGKDEVPSINLSDVRTKGPAPETVYAVVASDIHLRPTAPLARQEKGADWWYRVQGDYLKKLEDLCKHFNAPLVVAGDIFHKPSNPAELVNFAIDHWPRVPTYTIPGNHDLPYHQLRNLNKSSYYTLMMSGRISNLEEPFMVNKDGSPWRLVLHPFPWGRNVHPRPTSYLKYAVHLAVVHAYIWSDTTGYIPGMKPDRATNLSSYSKELIGYDAAVFGDNHIGFVSRTMSGVPVMNCGGFYRAKANERTYQPMVGLLQLSKLGTPYFWQVFTRWQEFWEEDATKVIAKTAEKFGDALDLEELVDLLEADDDGQLDFKQVVMTYAKKKIDPLMREVLLRCIQ